MLQPIIGLCGPIGAGKSRVAAEFERLGCLVIASDRLNHEILQTPDVMATLRQWWGDGVFGPDGRPDRSRIAAIVFAAAAQKQRLESLVYPLIARRRATMIKAVRSNSAIKAIVIDSPLLFESQLDRECDVIVYVDASESQRLLRLHAERGWDVNELKRREHWQLPAGEKRRRSHYVVDNGGPVAALAPQVADILERARGQGGTS